MEGASALGGSGGGGAVSVSRLCRQVADVLHESLVDVAAELALLSATTASEERRRVLLAWLGRASSLATQLYAAIAISQSGRLKDANPASVSGVAAAIHRCSELLAEAAAAAAAFQGTLDDAERTQGAIAEEQREKERVNGGGGGEQEVGWFGGRGPAPQARPLASNLLDVLQAASHAPPLRVSAQGGAEWAAAWPGSELWYPSAPPGRLRAAATEGGGRNALLASRRIDDALTLRTLLCEPPPLHLAVACSRRPAWLCVELPQLGKVTLTVLSPGLEEPLAVVGVELYTTPGGDGCVPLIRASPPQLHRAHVLLQGRLIECGAAISAEQRTPDVSLVVAASTLHAFAATLACAALAAQASAAAMSGPQQQPLTLLTGTATPPSLLLRDGPWSGGRLRVRVARADAASPACGLVVGMWPFGRMRITGGAAAAVVESNFNPADEDDEGGGGLGGGDEESAWTASHTDAVPLLSSQPAAAAGSTVLLEGECVRVSPSSASDARGEQLRLLCSPLVQFALRAAPLPQGGGGGGGNLVSGADSAMSAAAGVRDAYAVASRGGGGGRAGGVPFSQRGQQQAAGLLQGKQQQQQQLRGQSAALRATEDVRVRVTADGELLIGTPAALALKAAAAAAAASTASSLSSSSSDAPSSRLSTAVMPAAVTGGAGSSTTVSSALGLRALMAEERRVDSATTGGAGHASASSFEGGIGVGADAEGGAVAAHALVASLTSTSPSLVLGAAASDVRIVVAPPLDAAAAAAAASSSGGIDKEDGEDTGLLRPPPPHVTTSSYFPPLPPICVGSSAPRPSPRLQSDQSTPPAPPHAFPPQQPPMPPAAALALVLSPWVQGVGADDAGVFVGGTLLLDGDGCMGGFQVEPLGAEEERERHAVAADAARLASSVSVLAGADSSNVLASAIPLIMAQQHAVGHLMSRAVQDAAPLLWRPLPILLASTPACTDAGDADADAAAAESLTLLPPPPSSLALVTRAGGMGGWRPLPFPLLSPSFEALATGAAVALNATVLRLAAAMACFHEADCAMPPALSRVPLAAIGLPCAAGWGGRQQEAAHHLSLPIRVASPGGDRRAVIDSARRPHKRPALMGREELRSGESGDGGGASASTTAAVELHVWLNGPGGTIDMSLRRWRREAADGGGGGGEASSLFEHLPLTRVVIECRRGAQHRLRRRLRALHRLLTAANAGTRSALQYQTAGVAVASSAAAPSSAASAAAPGGGGAAAAVLAIDR